MTESRQPTLPGRLLERYGLGEEQAPYPTPNHSGRQSAVVTSMALAFADILAANEWEAVCRIFQKRRLLSHKMGVVDEDYVRKANDPAAIVGHKIGIGRNEIKTATGFVEALGKRLFDGIFSAGL